jgi:NADP-dependent 3-hydroxy acid dehydrogenase YdfG
MTLKQQVAIVTGASRGIGKEIASQLAKEGVKLSIVGSSEEIFQTEKELNDQGFDDILAVKANVTIEQEMQDLVSKTIQTFGRVDLLVNNAGVGSFKTVEETTADDWKNMFDVNVQGVFFASKAVLPQMKEQCFGTIITVSSDVARYTIANGSAYTATKYAVQGFMGALSQEVREHGIRVGTVNPGMVDTYLAGSKQGLPEKEDWLKVQDVANAVVYMASAPKHMMIDELVLHPFAQQYPIA